MFYPVFMDLRNRVVLVVGGGTIAERKVEALLEAEASVTVVAKDVTAHLQELHQSGKIRVVQREFRNSDMEGALLAISATDDANAQREIAAAAAAHRVMINTVDIPSLCDFIVPSVIRRGDVVLAISTSGKSPALAAALRARFSALLTEDVARAARLLGSIRPAVHERFPAPDDRKRVLERVVGSGILEWIADCDDREALRRMWSMIDSENGE